ncbi:hypothetical protein Mucpa_4978 [Mucilaginibacter paludis DSM 18603]|uniref:Uncharacterized protein n=1 Tax=Mucilaginibacter paludis DSM 18603 TaxID=714943 RepID=H1Y921_9SPHI|nr:hypothetical protein Mucpa_4978 [Mucilaginibacter paludis DSM 18603]
MPEKVDAINSQFAAHQTMLYYSGSVAGFYIQTGYKLKRIRIVVSGKQNVKQVVQFDTVLKRSIIIGFMLNRCEI